MELLKLIPMLNSASTPNLGNVNNNMNLNKSERGVLAGVASWRHDHDLGRLAKIVVI
jgi:hypothetical protein